ncbi:MAG: GGDEF domain-containing protein [Actinomycetales bacterium]|nr:GGDEF domain-containing protein [Actinomycetales bacterium]
MTSINAPPHPPVHPGHPVSARPTTRWRAVTAALVAAVAGAGLAHLGHRARIRVLRRELARSRHAARHDVLTGLGNRAVLNDQLDADSVDLLALVDLDGFKQVNDTHGHLAGDHVLRHIAHRLTAVLDDTGTAIRLGGDEFALTWPHPPPDALAAIEAVVSELARPIRLPHGPQLVPVATAGAAVAGTGLRGTALLAAADAALYTARATGRQVHLTTRPTPHPGPGGRRRRDTRPTPKEEIPWTPPPSP